MQRSSLPELLGRLEADNARLAADKVELLQLLGQLEADKTHLQRLNAQLQADNARLQEHNTQLQDQIKTLQQQLRHAKRQTHRFGRDKQNPNPRKPGRAKGHPGAHASRPDHIDQNLFEPLCGCPHCGGHISDVVDIEQFIVDLPEVRAFVQRIVTQRGYCAHCRRKVRSRHPAQVSDAVGAAAISLGPRALALAADLKHRMGMPYRKIADLLGTYLGLRVTHSALVQGSLRLARRGESTYALMVGKVSQSAVVHTDDTGWRIGRDSAWLWVFATKDLTVYVMSYGRGHQVVTQVLGEEFEGWLVSDGLPALDALDAVGFSRAQCLAHLVRRARELAADPAGPGAQFAGQVKGLLQSAIELSHRHEDLAPSTLRRYARRIERRCDELLALESKDEEHRKLAQHMSKHRDQLFVSLRDPAVDATNNLAEQQLRGAVTTRKIGGCNRSELHAHAHAVLASVAQTAHRQGQRLTDFVLRWFMPRAGPSLLAGTLPFLRL